MPEPNPHPLADLASTQVGPQAQRRPFTLVDQLTLVAVAGILLAVVLPSLLRSRMSANEASASGALKTIGTAQIEYGWSGCRTYASTLQALAGASGGAHYLDDELASGLKRGYTFSMVAGGFNRSLPSFKERCGVSGPYFAWSAEAHPVIYGRTGLRSFYVDETGILLGSDLQGAPGNSSMPEI